MKLLPLQIPNKTHSYHSALSLWSTEPIVGRCCYNSFTIHNNSSMTADMTSIPLLCLWGMYLSVPGALYFYFIARDHSSIKYRQPKLTLAAGASSMVYCLIQPLNVIFGPFPVLTVTTMTLNALAAYILPCYLFGFHS